MSKYITVVIEAPRDRIVVINPNSTIFTMPSVHFLEYATDLRLKVDRYPEYLLIKHLPPSEVFNYFIQNQT